MTSVVPLSLPYFKELSIKFVKTCSIFSLSAFTLVFSSLSFSTINRIFFFFALNSSISKILLIRSIMSNLVLFKFDTPLSIFVIKSKSLTIKFNLSTAFEAVFKYFLFTDLSLIAPSSKVKI